jgi:hypothetical protein
MKHDIEEMQEKKNSPCANVVTHATLAIANVLFHATLVIANVCFLATLGNVNYVFLFFYFWVFLNSLQ